MAGVDPHPPRPAQEDVEKPQPPLYCNTLSPNDTQSIPQTKNSNLQTNPSNIDPNQPIAKLSYSDILKGGNQQFLAVSSKSTGLNNCQGMDFDSVDLKPRTWYQGKPAVTFSVSEKKSLVEKLKFVLIGKFSHGRPAMIKIKELFTALKLHRPCNITVFDKKHIFIECACKIDYDRIWLKLNWIIDGFVMRIIKWTPDFIPIKESPIVPVWIRIEGLPLYLFDEVSLLSIANTIGKPIRVDPRNVTHTIVNYARICVELDVSQPLLHDLWVSFEDDKSKTMIEGFWVKVFYDVLPSFCHFCSHIGHDVSSCKRRVEESSRHKGVVVTSVVECRDPAFSAPGTGSASQDHATRAPPIEVQESSKNAQTGGPASRAAVAAGSAGCVGEPAKKTIAWCVGTARVVQTSIAKKTAAGSTTTGAKKTAALYTSENTTTGAAGDPFVHSEPARMRMDTRNSMIGPMNSVKTSIAGQNMLAGHTKTVQNAHETAELLITGNSFAALNEVVLIEDLTLEEGELAVEDICVAAIKPDVVSAPVINSEAADAAAAAAAAGVPCLAVSAGVPCLAASAPATETKASAPAAIENLHLGRSELGQQEAVYGKVNAADDGVEPDVEAGAEQDTGAGTAAEENPATWAVSADHTPGATTGAELLFKKNSFAVLTEEVFMEELTLEEGEISEEDVCATPIKTVVSDHVIGSAENVMEAKGAVSAENETLEEALEDKSSVSKNKSIKQVDGMLARNFKAPRVLSAAAVEFSPGNKATNTTAGGQSWAFLVEKEDQDSKEKREQQLVRDLNAIRPIRTYSVEEDLEFVRRNQKLAREITALRELHVSRAEDSKEGEIKDGWGEATINNGKRYLKDEMCDIIPAFKCKSVPTSPSRSRKHKDYLLDSPEFSPATRALRIKYGCDSSSNFDYGWPDYE